MKLFFEKYPVLIDPSLCWDFFWKSILVCGVRTSTEGHVLHGVRFLTPNRRQRTRRQKLELLQWIVALRWGGWDVSPEKTDHFKRKGKRLPSPAFFSKDVGIFRQIIPLTCRMQFFVEINSVHQKSPVYIFGIGWMTSMDVQCQGRRRDLQNHVPELTAIDWDKWWKMEKKKETLNECIIERLTSWPWKNIATDPLNL